MNLVHAYFRGARPFSQIFGSSKKRVTKILMSVLLAWGFICIAFLVGMNFYSYSLIGRMMGLRNIAFNMAVASCALITLVFDGLRIGDIMYAGNEIRLLLSLPVPHTKLYVSRFLIAYIFSMFSSLMITVPSYVSDVIVWGFSFSSLIRHVMMLLVIPFMVLSFCAFMTSLFFRRFRKTALEIIMYVLLAAVMIPVLASVNRNMDMITDPEIMASMVSKGYDVLNTVGNLGISSYLAFLICAVIGSVFIVLGDITAKDRLIVLNENATNRRKKTKKIRSSISSSVMRNLVRREFLTVRSEPSFMFELVGELLMPFILVILYSIMGVMGEFGSLIMSGEKYFPAIVFGLAGFFSSMNLTSCTSVSREGRSFGINRILPMNPVLYMDSKIMFHMIPEALILLIYMVCAFFITHLPVIDLVLIYIILFLGAMATSVMGLLLDFRNPRLDWDNAKIAMKNNANSVSMVIMLFIFVLPSVLSLIFIKGPAGYIIPFVLSVAEYMIIRRSALRACIKLLAGK